MNGGGGTINPEADAHRLDKYLRQGVTDDRVAKDPAGNDVRNRDGNGGAGGMVKQPSGDLSRSSTDHLRPEDALVISNGIAHGVRGAWNVDSTPLATDGERTRSSTDGGQGAGFDATSTSINPSLNASIDNARPAGASFQPEDPVSLSADLAHGTDQVSNKSLYHTHIDDLEGPKSAGTTAFNYDDSPPTPTSVFQQTCVIKSIQKIPKDDTPAAPPPPPPPEPRSRNFKAVSNTVMAGRVFARKGKPALTPAQAITRLTGTIFDSDDQIPEVLRPVLVESVTRADQIAQTIATYRPQIDKLMHWEVLTSSLYLTTSLFWCFVLGRLGFSFAWYILITIFAANAFRRNLAAMHRHVEVETTRNLAVRRMESETEPCEWLNKFIRRMWTQMEPSLSAQIREQLEPTLAASNVTLTHFTLGSASPRVETIRTIARTSDDVHLMDWDLNFTPVDEDDFSKREKELGDVRNSKIEVNAKVGPVGIPVLVTGIEFRGKMRVGIKYMSKSPYIKLVEYSFLEPPMVTFHLRPLKSLDLMDIGLAGLIDGIVAESLKGYVEPNKNIFDLEAFMEGSDANTPVGVLRVKIYEAKELKNRELTGVSDPYAKIIINGKEVCRTTTKPATLNPYWGEEFDIPIMSSHLNITSSGPGAPRPDELRIELVDKNGTLQDRSMGQTDALKLARWIKLLDSPHPTTSRNTDTAQPAADSSGDPYDIRGKISGDGVPLSRVERETLLAEWGSPFAVDSDVWHMVGGQEDRGEVRVDLTYFPLRPAIEDEKEAGEQEAKRMAQVAESATFAERRRMEEGAKELKKRKEEEVKARLEREQGLKAGVLTVVVHAARELPRGKGAAPFTSVGLVGVERGLGPQTEVGKTGTVKKTNNPVWDIPIVTYVEDVDKARLIVEVKDSRDNVSLGSCEVAVRDVVNKIKTPDSNDWFKLSKATGKIRLTFKWQPLDIERCHDPLSIIRKEPLGMLKVKVIEAKGVANVEAFRKSDPYMKVRLSRHVIGSTHVRENTLDPQFNEIFYAVCHSKREHLRLELFDFNKVKKDVSLGQVDLFLDEIFNAAVVYDAAGQKETPQEDEEEYDEDGNPLDKQDAASGSDPQREQWMSRQVKDGFKVTRLGANVMDVWAPVYIRVNEDAKVEDPSAKQAHTGAIGSAVSGTTHVIGTAGTMAGKVGSTALNFVGFGGAKAGQKGHIHFEVELMPVDQDHNVRPLTEEERERERELAKIAQEQEVARFVKEKIPKKHMKENADSKQSSLQPGGLAQPSLENPEPRRSSAERSGMKRPSLEKIPEEPSVKKADESPEPPTIKMADGNPQEKPAANEIEAMADVDVTKMDDGAEKHIVQIPTDNSGAVKNDMLHDAGVEEDDDYEVVLKKKVSKREYHACLESPQEVLKEYHAGIVRFRIHRAGRIARPSNYYIAILLDDEEAAHTRISPRSNSPEWEAPCDVFVKNIAAQKLKVLLKESRDDIKRGENDRVVGSWAGDITAVIGQKRSILDLGEGGELLASVGFAPIVLDADEEGSKNMGILYVDIVDAANLEAVDAGGSSDPYCIVDLNDTHIHRTAVHKRNLNPEFHESCHANVRSRLRSNLTITVRDHNALAFSKILGTVSLQLARVKPEELLFASLPLQGARGGFLRLRLYFEPKIMDDSAFEKEENARKEDGRLGKLVKGGAGVLGGTLKSSVEFLAGKHEPKQDQEGIVTAEEMARRSGAHVRLLDGGRVGERSESHAVHERSENHAGQERSESRTEHRRSESRADHERSENGSVKETAENRPGRERGDSAVALMAGSSKGSPVLEAGSPEAANELFAELIHEQEAHMLSGEVHLTIMAARDLKPVDLGGTSDPYVKVTQLVHGKEKTLLKTHVAKKTLNPVWPHANVVVKVPPSQLRFVIKDWNMFAESKALGEVDVDLAKLLPEGVTEFDAWLSLGLGGTGEIRIKGELRDHPSSRWSLHHKSSKDNGLGHPTKRVETDAHTSGNAGGLSVDGGTGSGDLGRSPSPSVDGSRVTFEDQDADGRSLAGSPDRKKYTIFQGRKKN